MYRSKVKKYERRLCKRHQSEELSFGCPGCYTVFCPKCLPENVSGCSSGEVLDASTCILDLFFPANILVYICIIIYVCCLYEDNKKRKFTNSTCEDCENCESEPP